MDEKQIVDLDTAVELEADRVVDVGRRSARDFQAGTGAGAPSDHGCDNSGHPVIELAVRRDGTAAFMVHEEVVSDPTAAPAYEVLHVRVGDSYAVSA